MDLLTKMMTYREIMMGFTILVFLVTGTGLPQEPATSPRDPLQQHVAGVELNDQSVVDGVAMVNRTTGLAVSVEYQLGATISGPAPPVKTLNVSTGAGTVSEVLDRLCALDPTFTWIHNRNMINVLPRPLASDPSYLLNRKVNEVTFQEVQGADNAVMKMVGQLPGPREQIAVLQVGGPVNFAKPWNATLKGVTIREVLNDIAQQLGPTYGWQFSGAQDFRMVTFHEGLSPRPSRSRQHQSESLGAR